MQLSANQVRTGDAIALQVAASQPGYVYLFQIGTDGKTLSMVFPNAMDGANAIAPGSPLTLPRPNWRMSARGPAGVGHLLAIVTEQPVDLMALQAGVSQGRVAVPGRYGATMATLREVAP